MKRYHDFQNWAMSVTTNTSAIDELAAYDYGKKVFDIFQGAEKYCGMVLVDGPSELYVARHIATYLTHVRQAQGAPASVPVREEYFKAASEFLISEDARYNQLIQQVCIDPVWAGLRTPRRKRTAEELKELGKDPYEARRDDMYLFATQLLVDHANHIVDFRSSMINPVDRAQGGLNVSQRTRRDDNPITETMWDLVHQAMGATLKDPAKMDRFADIARLVSSKVGVEMADDEIKSYLELLAKDAERFVQRGGRSMSSSALPARASGSWNAEYLHTYQFQAHEHGIDLNSTWILDEQLEYGPNSVINGLFIVAQRPSEVRIRDTGVHRDGGPAIEYRDGTKVYVMNGVTVPAWLAETPESKLDPMKFVELQNVEHRREFVRKFGMDRLLGVLEHDVLHKKGNYELIAIDLKGRLGKRPFLKMLNPSTGTFHVEGVPPNTKTVEEALEWRNGTKRAPSQLT